MSDTYDQVIVEGPTPRRRRGRRGSAGRARRTLVHTIRQLPNYVRMLGRLMVDPRVAGLDKALVAGALVYIITPIDFVPDVIPFFGQIDDIYLLGMALKRLVNRAGADVLAEHWDGDPDELSDMNMENVVGAAAIFLPFRLRRNLRGFLGRRARRGLRARS